MAGSRRETDLEAENAELRAQATLLREQLAALKTEVEELKRRLGQSSRNSSLPPSSDSPMSRQQRRALARERAKESLRQRPAASPATRAPAARWRRSSRWMRSSSTCPSAARAAGRISAAKSSASATRWSIRSGSCRRSARWSTSTASCAYAAGAAARRSSPSCRWGCLPRPSGRGSKVHVATLAGVFRLSRRQVAEVVREVFGIEISVGAVDATIMRMSAVLADPWRALAEAVREAEVVHADETGRRLAGAQQWLWLGASALCACYRIDPPAPRPPPRSFWVRTSAGS